MNVHKVVNSNVNIDVNNSVLNVREANFVYDKIELNSIVHPMGDFINNSKVLQ